MSDECTIKLIQAINDLANRVQKLEQDVAELKGQVQILAVSANTTTTIIKYVVTPLLIIVGALIGIKLTIP
ncbi:MAG: hypothetical protein ABIM21_00460 [candidate division WOR-3 bacterium]